MIKKVWIRLLLPMAITLCGVTSPVQAAQPALKVGVNPWVGWMNRAALGTPDANGPYYQVADMSTFMMGQKLIANPVKAATIIDATLLDGAAK